MALARRVQAFVWDNTIHFSVLECEHAAHLQPGIPTIAPDRPHVLENSRGSFQLPADTPYGHRCTLGHRGRGSDTFANV